MINLIIDLGVAWLEGVWAVATLFIFVIIGLQLFLSIKREDLSFQSFREITIEYSRIFTSIIILLGGIVAFSNLIQYTPDRFILGEFLAWFYFAYLFYEY